ncbi:MAG: hypothetical protein R3E84_09140 [Pseudomonadales bacterium]
MGRQSFRLSGLRCFATIILSGVWQVLLDMRCIGGRGANVRGLLNGAMRCLRTAALVGMRSRALFRNVALGALVLVSSQWATNAVSASATCVPGAGQASFFADTGYGGACITLDVGFHYFSVAPPPGSPGSQVAFPNDQLSSVKVGPGVTVGLYEAYDDEYCYDPYCQASAFISSDVSNLATVYNPTSAAGFENTVTSVTVSTDITARRFGADYVHDVQRNPAWPIANTPFTVSFLQDPYRLNWTQYQLAPGEYVRLFYVGGSCTNGLVGIRRYDAANNLIETVQSSGYVYGLSPEGFLHEDPANGIGTFFSATPGTADITYTPTSQGPESCATLLGSGESPPSGEAELLQAATIASGTRVTLQINGEPDGIVPDIQIRSSDACTDGELGVPAPVLGVITNPNNLITGGNHFDANGSAYVIEELAGSPQQYASASLVNGTASGDASNCIVVGPDNDSWTRAEEIPVATASPTATGFIDVPGRARWYKFSIQPNAKSVIELSNLPADYDVVVFKDIAKAYADLGENDDTDVAGLNRLGAEFAPSMFATSDVSPFAFSPEEISPFAFSPFAFSPFAFSPSVYAEDAVSPFAFSPFAYSPSALLSTSYSPFAFSPFAFSPFAFSPFAFSPENYSSAQSRSVIAVSATAGTGTERVSALTWDNTGDFYVRVAGKNGANDNQVPFTLSVEYDGGLCTGVEELTAGERNSLASSGVPGNRETIILFDSSRLVTDGFSLAEQQQLISRLNALAARSEVRGVVVDLGALAPVQMLHAQADAVSSCPYAENLTAEAIKLVIDSYRAANPDLAYVVLAGSDSQIPFFRYPDQTLLGPEQNYDPPMADGTQSQAALRLNYVLGQDQYGASTTLSLRDGKFPIPDLAVGRLVETPDEMITVLDAYLATADGTVPTPQSTLVTGYDFLQDAAEAIQAELVAGTTGARNETLIADAGISPDDPRAWNADALRNVLLAQGEDIIYLAGHFNAFSALAADFKTSMLSTELLNSNVDLVNSLIFSNGCHSGYNVVNGEVKQGVTLPLDWAQAFARKGATFIGGTGYQYGDTEFVEFGERLYLEFARQLRTGSGAVAIGKALVKAKQAYLERTADNKGLHRKSLLISTLFGLPMLKVDLPGQRLVAETEMSDIVAAPVASGTPGSGLGLLAADLSLDFGGDLTEQTIDFADLAHPPANPTDPFPILTASYLTGLDGLAINPAEPVLPLKSVNVSVADQSLRGIGFRGGRWSEDRVIPVDGAATTELRAPHSKFASLLYYPMRLAVANYYGALGDTGLTRLNVTPVQHRVDNIGDALAVRRRFDTLDYRLFYSDNTQTYGPNRPALSAPPTLTGARVVSDGNDVVFLVNAVGDPAAGMQSVWVVHTWSDGATPTGEWIPLDLGQETDTRLWSGRLANAASDSRSLDVVFVACNGVGLCTTDDNYGAYYHIVGAIGDVGDDGQPVNLVGTTLNFVSAPSSARSGDTITVTVTLQRSTGAPVDIAGEQVLFNLGGVTRSATTNAAGVATAELPLKLPAGDYALVASFAGKPLAGLAASSTDRPFLVLKTPTSLSVSNGSQSVAIDGIRSGVTATLTAGADHVPLQQRTVYFTITGGPMAVNRTVAAITDLRGVAQLGELALPAGSYSVKARFLGVIPGVLDEIVDPVYAATASQGLSLSLIGSAACPRAPVKRKLALAGFCYLTAPVDGKIDITDGTLIVGAGHVDQKIDQYGSGSVLVLQGGSVRDNVTERGAGDIVIHGETGGNLFESGSGDVFVGATGVVKGLVTEADDGSVRISGRVLGNVSESAAGDVVVETGGTVTGNVRETGSGDLVQSGTITGRTWKD